MLEHFTTRVLLVLTWCTILAVPFLVSAHGTGASFEQDAGTYRVDIGYEPEELRAGDTLLLNFNLLTSEGRPANFSSVWVRIEEGSESILATGVAKPAVGPATLLLTLPTSAEFTLHVRFERGETVLAEASFPFTVAPGEESRSNNDVGQWVFGGLAGLILGMLGTLLLGRRT